ncbi:1-acyl-sn-glycerol-3-phosphate acyltransferase [Peptoniphilus sp. GNH]|nr:Acyltransferase [Clostridiales bacterium KA00134]UHR03051.1 1-acyl-sn-glycerol-3-phosphate acyltransferase [Peptoniphilus sp. GNH]
MSLFYKIARFLVFIYLKIFFRLEGIGFEKIDYDKKLIISGNHHTIYDPLIISSLIKKQVFWMGKKELWDCSRVLGFFLSSFGAFPVDRDGNDIGAIKKAIKYIRNNKILGIFPEGTRTDFMDLDLAKNGAVLMATRTAATIVPVYIDRRGKIFKKIKVYVRDPIDYKGLGKLEENDLTRLTRDLMLSIYDKKRDYIS